MLGRRLALFFALLVGLAATQLPEFLQQYRQRLGGAIDELAADVASFDDSAARQGVSEDAGLARLKANGDPLVQDRGQQTARTIARFHRLQAEQAQIDAASPAGRYVTFLADFDARIAARAYEIYRPAVPVTLDSLAIGGVGFFAGGALFHLCHWPFRAMRRRRRADTVPMRA